MKAFTKFVNQLCVYVGYCGMAALVFVMCMMAGDVFLRYVLNRPILGAYEISIMILSILIFSSWSYTQTVHGHVHVTMFIGRMPPRLRFICFGITSLLSTVVMSAFCVAVFQQTFKVMSTRASTGILLIPHWPFVALECIAIGIFTLTLLLDAIKAVLAIFNEEYAAEVMSYWGA